MRPTITPTPEAPLDQLDLEDEKQIRRAMELADEAAHHGEVPVGAVLIIGDLVIETANERERRPDPTAHAEILALREAARRLGSWRLSGATVYVTKEPCPMCAGALIAARVARVVFGAYDAKGGAAGSVIDLFNGAAVFHWVEITGGVCESEAAQQLQDFFRHRRQGASNPERYHRR